MEINKNTSHISFETTFGDLYLKKVYDSIDYPSDTSGFFDIDNDFFFKSVDEIFGKGNIATSTSTYYFTTTKSFESIPSYFMNPCEGVFIFVEISIENNEQADSTTERQVLINNYKIYYDIKHKEKVDKFNALMQENAYVPNSSNQFYIIVVDGQGNLTLRAEKAIEQEINLELNYGKKFVKTHEKIMKALKETSSGLLLLHGDPGTGKTSWSRYMISLLCNDKKIIYVPSFMMEQLANPEFMSFIKNQKNSILILEDAETVLSQREDGFNTQAVSNILNMTNGLLNDVMKIQIIATFNMDKKQIDKALLRPGRLIDDVKFDKLSPEEANELSAHLGKNINYNKPVTLAEIYTGEMTVKRKRRVGFKDDDEHTPETTT